jgi:hypothetical protein
VSPANGEKEALKRREGLFSKGKKEAFMSAHAPGLLMRLACSTKSGPFCALTENSQHVN